jgi:hypothetical protein
MVSKGITNFSSERKKILKENTLKSTLKMKAWVEI